MKLCKSGGAFAVDMGVRVSTTFTFLQILLLGNVAGEPPSICRETTVSRVECNLTFAWRVFSIQHMLSRLQQATSHRRRPTSRGAISVSVLFAQQDEESGALKIEV